MSSNQDFGIFLVCVYNTRASFSLFFTGLVVGDLPSY